MQNVIKSALLFALLTLLLLFCGYALGGRQGMTTALIFSLVMNFSCYWFSDKMVLSMYRAQPLEETQAPQIHQMVREISQQMKIPMPAVYLIPSTSPNAFATGRDPSHAVVAVTQGILEWLEKEELRGVLAHELAHVKHRDILTSTVVASLAGAIGYLTSMIRWSVMFTGSRRDDRRENPLVLLIMMFLMPLAATLVQLAVSRSREFHADEEGGTVCGNPLYLASALKKLEAVSKKIPMREASPETAHLFIFNPLREGNFNRLFSTHPPTEERIARLEAMARQQGL